MYVYIYIYIYMGLSHLAKNPPGAVNKIEPVTKLIRLYMYLLIL